MSERVEREVLQLVTDGSQFFGEVDKAIGKGTELRTSFEKSATGAKVMSSEWRQFGQAISSSTGPIEKFETSITASGLAAHGAFEHIQKVDQLFRQFSGADASQNAEVLATAVHKIGGASKLTAVDAQHVNKSLKDLIERSRLMGTEVPKHLRDLEVATRPLPGAFGKISTAAKGSYMDLQRVDQLTRQFSGADARQRADELAAAIQRVGGVSKLSAEDLRGANTQLKALLEQSRQTGAVVPQHFRDLEASTGKALAGLKAVHDQGAKTTTMFGGMTSRIEKVALGYVAGAVTLQAFISAGRKVLDFLRDSVAEFLEAEKTQRQLTAALTTQGTAMPAVIAHYDELAKKHQKLSVHSADALRQTQLLLVQVGGVLPSEMDQALNAVTNLAAGLGIDLPAAAKMVATSFEDSFGGLKKAGVQIDQARAKAEGMSYVLGQIQAKFGGQAQAELDTYSGKLAQLENAWNDLKQELGRTLVETGALGTGLQVMNLAVILLGFQLKKANAELDTLPNYLEDLNQGVGPIEALWNWFSRSNDELVRMNQHLKDVRANAEALKRSSSDVRAIGMSGPVGPSGDMNAPGASSAGVFGQATVTPGLAPSSWHDVEKSIREERMAEEARERAAKSTKEFQDQVDSLRKKMDTAMVTARAWVAAIGSVSNVGRETHEVQLEINKAVTAGIEAYRAAGKEAPAAMRAIAAETVRLAVLPDAMAKANQEAITQSEKFFGEMNDVANKQNDARWKRFTEVQSASLDASLRTYEIYNKQMNQSADESSKRFEVQWKQFVSGLSAAQNISEQFADTFASDTDRMVLQADKWRAAQLQAIEPLRQQPKEYAKALGQIEAIYAQMIKRIDLGVFASRLNLVSGLLRAVGQSATGSFRTVIAVIDQASTGVFDFIKVLKAAKTTADLTAASMSAIWTSATFGISTVFQAIAAESAQQEELRRRAEALKEEMKELGFTLEEFRALQMSVSGGSTKWGQAHAQAFKTTKDLIRETSDEITKGLRRAQDAMVLLGGKAPSALQPYIAELLKAKHLTDDQRKALESMSGAPSWKDIVAIAEQRGIGMDALGEKVGQARIKDISFTYTRELEALAEAGADADGVLRGFADELIALALQAQKSGHALPKTLEQYIARLRALGIFVDETGNAIGELTFKEMEDDSLKGMVSELQKIAELLERLLPQAAEKGAAGIRRAFRGISPPDMLPGFQAPGDASNSLWSRGGALPTATPTANITLINQMDSDVVSEKVFRKVPLVAGGYSI